MKLVFDHVFIFLISLVLICNVMLKKKRSDYMIDSQSKPAVGSGCCVGGTSVAMPVSAQTSVEGSGDTSFIFICGHRPELSEDFYSSALFIAVK